MQQAAIIQEYERQLQRVEIYMNEINEIKTRDIRRGDDQTTHNDFIRLKQLADGLSDVFDRLEYETT